MKVLVAAPWACPLSALPLGCHCSFPQYKLSSVQVTGVVPCVCHFLRKQEGFLCPQGKDFLMWLMYETFVSEQQDDVPAQQCFCVVGARVFVRRSGASHQLCFNRRQEWELGI